MTKTIIICALLAIVGFGAGYLTCQKVNVDIQLIDAQNAALEKAEIVMDNNDLWDIDGSDDMAEYMELTAEVDSIWKTK
jgi:hypothetical protein